MYAQKAGPLPLAATRGCYVRPVAGPAPAPREPGCAGPPRRRPFLVKAGLSVGRLAPETAHWVQDPRRGEGTRASPQAAPWLVAAWWPEAASSLGASQLAEDRLLGWLGRPDHGWVATWPGGAAGPHEGRDAPHEAFLLGPLGRAEDRQRFVEDWWGAARGFGAERVGAPEPAHNPLLWRVPAARTRPAHPP